MCSNLEGFIAGRTGHFGSHFGSSSDEVRTFVHCACAAGLLLHPLLQTNYLAFAGEVHVTTIEQHADDTTSQAGPMPSNLHRGGAEKLSQRHTTAAWVRQDRDSLLQHAVWCPCHCRLPAVRVNVIEMGVRW